MRILLALILCACALRADELIKSEWTIAPDGSTWIWPNLETAAEQRTPAQWLGIGLLGEEARLFESLLAAGPVGTMLIGLPGTADSASLCDAEHHFKKLKLGSSDAEVLARMRATPEAKLMPALRRARLDRILAVRLAGERKMQAALPTLKQMATDGELEPFLRRAALESAAAIEGKAMPPFRCREPLAVLADVPANAQVVVMVDQRQVPRWKKPWRIAYDGGIRTARKTIAMMGAAVTDSDLGAGQCQAEVPLEISYEIARQLGNHRRFWSVHGIWDSGVFTHIEGDFDVDAIENEMQRAKVSAKNPFGPGSRLTVQPDSVRINYGTAAAGGIAEELTRGGIGAGDAIWVRVRDVSLFKPIAPMLVGVEEITLSVRLKGGIEVNLVAACKDEGTARGLKATVTMLLLQAPAPLVKHAKAAKIEPKGKHLFCSLKIEGKTPEDLLAAIAAELE